VASGQTGLKVTSAIKTHGGNNNAATVQTIMLTSQAPAHTFTLSFQSKTRPVAGGPTSEGATDLMNALNDVLGPGAVTAVTLVAPSPAAPGGGYQITFGTKLKSPPLLTFSSADGLVGKVVLVPPTAGQTNPPIVQEVDLEAPPSSALHTFALALPRG